MNTKNDEPAFPAVVTDGIVYAGLTKRELISAMVIGHVMQTGTQAAITGAVHGINMDELTKKMNPQGYAEEAVKLADALLAQLNKEKE